MAQLPWVMTWTSSVSAVPWDRRKKGAFFCSPSTLWTSIQAKVGDRFSKTGGGGAVTS